MHRLEKQYKECSFFHSLSGPYINRPRRPNPPASRKRATLCLPVRMAWNPPSRPHRAPPLPPTPVTLARRPPLPIAQAAAAAPRAPVEDELVAASSSRGETSSSRRPCRAYRPGRRLGLGPCTQGRRGGLDERAPIPPGALSGLHGCS